jgi:hypothetical protein
MKHLQKELQSAVKALNSLAAKIDAISKKLGGAEKAAPVVKSLAKATRKPATSKTVKKSAPKKAAAPTASETVLKTIGRYKKGINTAALIEKTGFNTKKIRNIVFRLRKQGKIKSPKKGVYAKA